MCGKLTLFLYGKLLWVWHKNQGVVEMGKLVRTLQLKKKKNFVKTILEATA